MTDLMTRLRHWGRLGARALPRPSVGWLAMRLLGWGLGIVALLLPLPSDFLGPAPLALAAVVALVAAALPGTVAVLGVELLAVAAWLVVTWAVAEPISPPRVLAFAATLYLHHVVSAFAAVLPTTAALSPAVLTRALGRTGVVLAASVALGTVVFLAAGWLSAESPLVAPLAGLGAALGVAALLVHLLHRRSR